MMLPVRKWGTSGSELIAARAPSRSRFPPPRGWRICCAQHVPGELAWAALQRNPFLLRPMSSPPCLHCFILENWSETREQYFWEQAFDMVCHKLLLLKLNMLSIDCNLLKLIECFLIAHNLFPLVVLTPSLQMCVPQGSTLGPLLFLIYINDLPSLVNSHTFLFAVDCIIFREITNANDNSLF